MEMGSSTVGACGDVSRNVMCTPAPKVSKPYAYAREYSKVMAELLKPSSTAFSEIWLGDEKVAGVEYWRKDIDDAGVMAAAAYDSGRGVMTSDKVIYDLRLGSFFFNFDYHFLFFDSCFILTQSSSSFSFHIFPLIFHTTLCSCVWLCSQSD
jgi:sulfite reductase beta subunit-like hemoprotein